MHSKAMRAHGLANTSVCLKVFCTLRLDLKDSKQGLLPGEILFRG